MDIGYRDYAHHIVTSDYDGLIKWRRGLIVSLIPCWIVIRT
jgi:hypothetical protein